MPRMMERVNTMEMMTKMMSMMGGGQGEDGQLSRPLCFHIYLEISDSKSAMSPHLIELDRLTAGKEMTMKWKA